MNPIGTKPWSFRSSNFIFSSNTFIMKCVMKISFLALMPKSQNNIFRLVDKRPKILAFIFHNEITSWKNQLLLFYVVVFVGRQVNNCIFLALSMKWEVWWEGQKFWPFLKYITKLDHIDTSKLTSLIEKLKVDISFSVTYTLDKITTSLKVHVGFF